MSVANTQNIHPTLGNALTLIGTPTHNAGGLLADAQAYPTGAEIDAFLTTACTDITDPAGSGGWNTVWDLSVGFPRWIQFVGSAFTGSISGFAAWIDSTETAGDAIRMQLTIDGEVIFDSHVIKGAVGQAFQGMAGEVGGLSSGTYYTASYASKLIYVESSIELLIAKKGTLAVAATRLSIPAVCSPVFNY